MVISLFGKITSETKLVYKYGDSVVIGSRTNKEYAFQVGNFMNMLYSNLEEESQCMTNKVVLHNLSFEINRLKPIITGEQYHSFSDLLKTIKLIPYEENGYELFDKCCDIISNIFSEYYFKPDFNCDKY